MRFLGIFCLGLVDTRTVRNIAGVIAIRDRLARGRNSAAVHLHPVGPHIGDRTVFIKLLGNPHGVTGGIAELARGFLLQGRSRERWRRIAGERFGFDRFNRKQAVFNSGLGQHGLIFVGQIHLAKFLAVMDCQPGFKCLPTLFHLRCYRPIFLWLENLDFAFPLDDQTERDRLHTAGGFCARKLAPQDW